MLLKSSPKCIESFIGSKIRQPNYTVPEMAKSSVVSRSHDLTKSQNPCFASKGIFPSPGYVYVHEQADAVNNDDSHDK